MFKLPLRVHLSCFCVFFYLFNSAPASAYDTGILFGISSSPMINYVQLQGESSDTKSTYGGTSFSGYIGYGLRWMSIQLRYQNANFENRYEDSTEKRQDTNLGIGIRLFPFASIYATAIYWPQTQSKITADSTTGIQPYTLKGKKTTMAIGYEIPFLHMFDFSIEAYYVLNSVFDTSNDVTLMEKINEQGYGMLFSVEIDL